MTDPMDGTVEGVYRHGFVVRLDLGYRTFVSWADLWQGHSGTHGTMLGGCVIKAIDGSREAMRDAIRDIRGDTDWAFLSHYGGLGGLKDGEEPVAAAGGAWR